MKRLAMSKRAHLRVLRVELVEVGDSLREVLDGHVVAVLVLPLSSLHLGTTNLEGRRFTLGIQ